MPSKNKTYLLVDLELDSIESHSGKLIKIYNIGDTSSSKLTFSKGNILYSKLRPYLKKYYFANFDGICSSEFWVFQPSNKIYDKFFFYYVQTDKFNYLSNKTCGTKMPRAEWSLLQSKTIFFPRIYEQKKISKTLDYITSIITALETKLTVLKKYKEGFTNEWFLENKKPTKLLNELVVQKTSQLLTSHFKVNSGVYPVYDAGGRQYTYINFYNNDTDSIAIIKYGSGCGRTFVTHGLHSVLGTMSEMVPNDQSMLEYIYAFTLSNEFKRTCHKYTEIGTTPNLYFSDYSDSKVYLPSKIEIDNFMSIFELFEQLEAIYQCKTDLLNKVKKYLINSMFI